MTTSSVVSSAAQSARASSRRSRAPRWRDSGALQSGPGEAPRPAAAAAASRPRSPTCPVRHAARRCSSAPFVSLSAGRVRGGSGAALRRGRPAPRLRRRPHARPAPARSRGASSRLRGRSPGRASRSPPRSCLRARRAAPSCFSGEVAQGSIERAVSAWLTAFARLPPRTASLLASISISASSGPTRARAPTQATSRPAIARP